MSATFPDHERPDSSVIRTSIPQSDSQMEQATHPKPRGPGAGDARVTAAHANVTDDGTLGTSVRSGQDTQKEPKEVNKRSLDYVLRSGCAGGLAGCAVSAIFCTWVGSEKWE